MTSRPREDSLDIRANELLKPYTTFKIGGPARHFAEIRGERDLGQAIAFARSEHLNLFVLGGGSNVVISDAGFDGLVAHPVHQGIELVEEGAESVILRIHTAEVWDAAVAYAVDRGWWGIENLSHIPGQAGAALVQNIGAYGQQMSDVFERAEVMDLSSAAVRTLTVQDCRLAYRSSIFNTSERGRYFILSLTLRLDKRARPHLEYADVKAHFAGLGMAAPSQMAIRQAIISIRDRKFPFPREERGGNAGSFFKNLTLSEAEYERLESSFGRNFGPRELSRLRDIRNRLATRGGIRIPTAFLIEVCGLKGLEAGRAKVNETQPLVLLNQGGATASDVMQLARLVRRTVYQRTGLAIGIEPELVGFAPDELNGYLALE